MSKPTFKYDKKKNILFWFSSLTVCSIRLNISKHILRAKIGNTVWENENHIIGYVYKSINHKMTKKHYDINEDAITVAKAKERLRSGKGRDEQYD